jgi:phenylpropionate dioxygenase-like ring-hydroxylating dioxygenase large terminal subunit
MSPDGTDDADSYRRTKRFFPKHPEIGPAGMSAEPFRSQEQFELERDLLWPRTWLMVGRAEEIPKPGSYFVKEIPTNSVSLIVIRGRDGKIRSFHNVCPHRGSQLCWDQHGSVAGLTCPYHGFSFNLEGQLTFVPDEANFYDLDKSKMGLTPVHTDEWAGFIFVHLDPNPRETLKEFLGEIGESLEQFPFHERTRYYEYKAVIECNWKVLISGFLEAYHARALHARSVNRISSKDNPYAHNEFIRMYEKHRVIGLYSNPNMTPTRLGKITYAHYNKAQQKYGQAQAPAADGQDAFRALNKTYLIHNIFPNFQLNLVRGNWFRHQFWPLAVDKTLWEVRLYYPKPRNASERFFQDYSRYTSRDNLMEDVMASEKSQPGLASGLVKRWVLQDEEVAIQHFNKVVADYTQTQRRPAAE